MDGDASLLGPLIAALGGAAVGLERQWSGHADGPSARFAGIRTFTMLGAVGGLAGWLWALTHVAAAVVLLGGAVAIVAAAYAAASRRDIDATTEVAALVVIAAGLIAGIGAYAVASGIVAITSLLLLEKSRLHQAVARLDDVELRAAARFAIMALVVLPLLPRGPFGPFGGIRPRELWALVLFFSGLSFVGYAARRMVGPGRGLLVTGLAGGLISSTSVTFTFARDSRRDPASAAALAFGAVAANAMLYPRVLIAIAVINPALLSYAAPYLIPPAVVVAAIALLGTPRRSEAAPASAPAEENPLQLTKALQMTVLFQAVMMLVHLSARAFGEVGVVGSAAALGLTDVDVLTVSMSRAAAGVVAPEAAALAIAVGVLSNSVLKLGVALVFGLERFRWIAGGTLTLMVAAAAAAIRLVP